MPTVTQQGSLQLPYHRPVFQNEKPSVVKVIDVNTLNTVPAKSLIWKKVLLAAVISVVVIAAAVTVSVVLTSLPTTTTTTTTTTTMTMTMTMTTTFTAVAYNSTITPCPVGYTGTFCQTPLCNGQVNGCANGGTCSAPSVCTCSTGWTGPTCSTVTAAVCSCICQNGGTCALNSTCLCTSRYTGTCCTSLVFAAVLWSFDGNLNDYYNVFNAAPDNGRTATYVSPGYKGSGSALSLGLSGTSQSVSISTFVSIYHTSFTLEAWIYPTSFAWTYGGNPDNALFGQCQYSSQDQCLHIILRSQRIYFGFYGDDLQGNIVFQTHQWYHVAYAYEQSTQQQYTYVNGANDGQRPSNQYSGQAGSFTIGTSTQINTPNNFFQGYFDEMSLVPYCKTAAQIQDDATHVVYYKFDTAPGITSDSGPLSIDASSVGVSLVSSPAIANQSLYFPSGTSYFQFQGLTYFGTSNWPYSISIWIYPLSQSGGTIVHANGGYSTNGFGSTGWCAPLLGFSSSGVLYAQSTSSTSSLVVLAGPTVALNTWTYIAVTYSTPNGLRLYANGTLQTSTSLGFEFISSGSPNTITLGSSLSGFNSTFCPQGSITSGQYQGYMDSFSFYSRELNSADVLALYNTPQP